MEAEQEAKGEKTKDSHCAQIRLIISTDSIFSYSQSTTDERNRLERTEKKKKKIEQQKRRKRSERIDSQSVFPSAVTGGINGMPGRL